MRVPPPAELIPVSDVALVELPDSDLTRTLVQRLCEAQADAAARAEVPDAES